MSRRPPDHRPPPSRADASPTGPTARSGPTCICPLARARIRVVVLVHGGSWQERYGRIVMRGPGRRPPPARLGGLEHRVPAGRRRRRLAGHVRRRGRGDRPAARRCDAPLDLSRTILLGHSAGGHLALWAAWRGHLPPGAPGFRDGRPARAPGAGDRPGRRVRPRRRLRALARRRGTEPDGRLVPRSCPSAIADADPMRRLVPVASLRPARARPSRTGPSRSSSVAATPASWPPRRPASVDLVEIEGPAGAHRRPPRSRADAGRGRTADRAGLG